MKKCIPFLLTLCLLLTACGGIEDGGESQPTAAPDPFTPYYSDYTVRSMQATVMSGTEELEGMAALNNLYQNQATMLYKTLNTPAYRESYLSVPTGIPWVSITFRPHSDPSGETYKIYENDLVLVEHPAVGEQLYTAAAGTYYQTVTYLNRVREEQVRYVTVQGYGSSDSNDPSAGYTIYYKSGRSEFVGTGTDAPRVDLVGEGLVRVYFRDTYRFYDTVKGRDVQLAAIYTDVAGGYVAAADRTGVALYPLFSKKAAARVFVASVGEDIPVQGVSFTADGTQLHIICRRGDTDTVWDRTLTVADLLASTRYYLGAWQDAPDATEKEQQTVGYALLKKLRHKEKELGHTLSSLPQKRLELGDDVYFLTEMGYWEKVEGEYVYTPVAHLLVNEAVTVAYEAVPADNELTWDIKKDWTKT